MKKMKIFAKKPLKARGVQMKKLIALFLVFAFAFSTFYALNSVFTVAAITSSNWDAATASAVAAGMRWDFPGAENYNASAYRLLLWQRYQDKIPTYVYGLLSPNPVGVNQEMTITMFNPVVPPAGTAENTVRYQYLITVTDPEGVKTTIPATGTITSDATGTAYTKYTPTKVGNYSVTIKFNELFYRWYELSGKQVSYAYTLSQKDYYGVTLLESTNTYTLVVQTEHVSPTAITDYPLPTEYWTRPIEGQNQAWGQIHQTG